MYSSREAFGFRNVMLRRLVHDYLSVPSRPMKKGAKYCPEASVINNQSTYRNIPGDRNRQLPSLQPLQQK